MLQFLNDNAYLFTPTYYIPLTLVLVAFLSIFRNRTPKSKSRGFYYSDTDSVEYTGLDPETMRHEIEVLKHQHAIESQKLHLMKSQQLQPELNNVLDYYEQSNVRIPSDIIEDASTRYFENENQALSYIEQQRNVWKNESMKRIDKGIFK